MRDGATNSILQLASWIAPSILLLWMAQTEALANARYTEAPISLKMVPREVAATLASC